MILADTAPLLAMVDHRDPYHGLVRAFVRDHRPRDIAVPSPVVGELAYWLGLRLLPDQEAALLRRLASGALPFVEPHGSDWARAADLVEQYSNFPLGTVDALIVAMAERLGVTTIFTLDRRHFGAVKPTHCEHFEIVP